MNIAAFLAANPGLNLQTAELFGEDALAQYNWPAGDDKKALLQALRTRQRLLKVYPDESIAEVLESLGLHSAHHIASLGEDAFTQSAAPMLTGIDGADDSQALASTLFSNARRIQRSSFELALAQPQAKMVAPAPNGNQKPDFQHGVPDYERLFGPMLNCDCEDCQSIYSPAAYFTDLMRVVTNYITQPTKKIFTLNSRRPDLWSLPLDCNTAETEVSYLDIVNNILKQNLQLNYYQSRGVMQAIASSVYPFNTPYNEPLETISMGLSELGTSLSHVYSLMEAAAPASASAELNLSPEQLKLVTGTSGAQPWQLYGFYTSPSNIYEQLGQQRVFLKQTGLQPDMLNELINQNLKKSVGGYSWFDNGSQDIGTQSISNNAFTGSITVECWIYPTLTYSRMSAVGKGTANEFYIYINNGVLTCTYGISATTANIVSNTAIELNTWTHIAWTRDVSTGLNQIYINGRLDASSTLTAGNAVSSDLPVSIGYLPNVNATSFHGANTELRIWPAVRTQDQIRSLMYTRLEYYQIPDVIAYWPLNESSGSTAYDLGPNQYNAAPANFDFLGMIPCDQGGKEINTTIGHGLYLNGVLSAGQYLALNATAFDSANNQLTPAAICITDGSTISALTDAALNQLAVYIRLRRHTGWSFENLDWILKSVSGIQTTVNNTVVESLATVIILEKQFNVKPDELSALWFDMKTYGRGNDVKPQDLWDKVFNSPPMMADSGNTGELAFYRPTYSLNPLFNSAIISWTFINSSNPQDQRLANHLSSALGVSGADLAAIVNLVAPGVDVVQLTVPLMSQLYRLARFPQMLGMRIPDFISLLGLTGQQFANSSTAWTLTQVQSICKYAGWLKKKKLSVQQLAFLTTPNAPKDNLQLPEVATVKKALGDMVESSGQTRVKPDSFMSSDVDSAISQQIFSQLVQQKLIDDNGLVLNIQELTLINVYKALAANLGLAQQIIKAGPAVSVLDFSSANGDTVEFTFDPFADETIQSTNSYTINLWMKPASTYTGGWPRMLGNTQTGTDNQSFKSPGVLMVQYEDKYLQVESTDNNGAFHVRQAEDYLQWANQWVFVSFVNDGGTWTLYRNGQPVSFLPGSSNGPFNPPYEQTGDSPTYYMSSAYTGSISNVTIWNIARTGVQLQQDMFASYTGSENGLVACWPVDEGEGTTINNLAVDGGAAYNGAFTNSKNTPNWVPNSGLASVQRVLQVLLDARDSQTGLVIKTLAGLASLSQQVISGVCELSSVEVDNATALGVSPGPLPYAPNLLLNPDTETNPNYNAYLTQVQLNGALARWFKLTGEETAGISAYSQKFEPGAGDIGYGTTVFTLQQLVLISEYKSLQQLCNTTNGLIGYFQQAPASGNTPTDAQLALLADLTGWNVNELTAIIGKSYFNNVNFNTIPGLRKLANIMAMEEKLNMGIASLNALRSVATYSASNNGNWQAYEDTAVAVVGALAVKKGAQSVDKLQERLAQQERNVLCDTAIWRVSSKIDGVSNRDELYEFLLVDVNMSAGVKTSLTVAAMNSLQLYVNRCISNMEPGVTNNIPQAWWKWMSTYRVWQANREVYLYPENYVDPSLRKLQSTQFKQFINDVSKGQVSDDNVKQAMANYLESVNEVSNLELIDGFVNPVYRMTQGTSQDNKKSIIFLVARSRTSPADFYTRAAIFVTSNNAVYHENVLPDEASEVFFGAWQKIDLKVNSDYISTVVAFGRQFIFWVEQTEIVNTGSNSNKYTTVFGTIYYSYRDLQANWVAPVVLQKDIVISVFGAGLPDINYYEAYLDGAHIGDTVLHKQYPFYKAEGWNKLKLQYLPSVTNAEESILVILGDLVGCGPNASTEPPKPPTNLTGEQVTFQRQLYNAARYCYLNKAYTTTIIPGTMLFSSLLQKQVVPEIIASIPVSSQNALFIEGILELSEHQTALSFAPTNNLLSPPLPARVSWWPLMQNYGLTTSSSAKDIVSGNNGTGSGITNWENQIVPGQPWLSLPVFTLNNFFYFNWSSHNNNSTTTTAFWIHINSAAAGFVIRQPNPPNYDNYTLAYCYFTGSSMVFASNNKSSTLTKVSVPFTQNRWYFVAVTTTSSALNIYLNGILQSPSPYNSAITTASVTSMQFGCFSGYAFGLQYWNVALTPTAIKFLYGISSGAYLSGLHKSTSSLYRLNNSAGSFAFNTGNQSYLVFPDLLTKTYTISQSIKAKQSLNSDILQIYFSRSPIDASNTGSPLMRFVRVNTDTVPLMISALARGGMDALFTPTMQYLPEESLADYMPSPLAKLPADNAMNFNGAFSVYFWEIFFYAPYLIAEKLRNNSRFAEAEKWYQYIFDPASLADMPAEKWYDFLFSSQGPVVPVAFWPISKNSSTTGTQFNDLKNGIVLTATGVSEQIGQRVPFAFLNRPVWNFNAAAATTAYTSSLPAELNPTDAFTITAWVKLTAAPTQQSGASSNSTIVNCQNGTTGYHLFFQYVSTTVWLLNFTISAKVGSDSSVNFVNTVSGYLSTLNEWQFVAATFNGKSTRVYINGINVTQTPVTNLSGYVPNSGNQFRVGSGNSAGLNAWYFTGSIADVAFYDHALHGRNIMGLYQNYTSTGPNAAFWKFRPFQRINAVSLYHILRGDAWSDQFLQPAEYYTASMQMAVYAYDPFDADALARLRVNSWQKATFMRYIDNLINWGDSLFTQDSWETLSDATMRYVLASTLLGPLPLKTVVEEPQRTVNYELIQEEYGAANVPQFLIDMENQLSQLGPDATLPEQVQSVLDAYFCIPSNKKMIGYWETVADRLYKLRHGLTINGAPNVVPLYAPPIDPAKLVAAGGAGGAALSPVINVPSVPWFRFTYLIAQAKSVASEVTRLGGELLAALEKKDAEQLARLQAGYQVVLGNIETSIKASQINQLLYVGEGLQASYNNAQYVHNTYRDWMLVPLGPLELLSLVLSAESLVGQGVSLGVKALAVPAYLLPNIFGLADGGMNFGESINAGSGIIEGGAHLVGGLSQILAQMGQYVRRELEWDLQKNIAGNQMKEIEAQIQANSFALEAARSEATLSQTQLKQAQEVLDFQQSKFTNEELYEWMSGQLSALYFQMYQLAWSLAQSTQTALQYELNIDQTYLNGAAWNPAYQGLLAGDTLSLILQQMENAYIKGNNRKLQIRKTWSMKQNNPQAFLTLVSSGNCRFDLAELSYDLDFPGHYNRKIKSLSVTIPAVVGPYQNIHATLIQTGNVVCTKASVAAVEYLLGLSTSLPSDGSLRVNWNPNQEIAISTGINDAGVFQVNFNDEQYLPFEGTGAVSSWSLSIPQAANGFPLRSISDIIITVDYMADDGGSAFASQVTALSPLTNYQGYQYLSMRQLYSASWFSFCNNPSGGVYSLPFELVTQMYPANLQATPIYLGNADGEIGLIPVLQPGYKDGLPVFSINSNVNTWTQNTGLVPISENGEQLEVPGKGEPWTLSAQQVDPKMLINGNINQEILQDIILVIPFNGTLNW